VKVEFDATLDDFVDVQNRVRVNWRRTAVASVLFGVLIGSICFGTPVERAFEGCINALFYGILLLVSPLIVRPLEKLILRRRFYRYRERIQTGRPVKVEVEITELGVLVRQLGTQRLYDWKRVQSVEERGDSIELWIKRWHLHRPLIVRGRAFDSIAHRSEFLDLCKKWSNQ
jgi:hypothetical protein